MAPMKGSAFVSLSPGTGYAHVAQSQKERGAISHPFPIWARGPITICSGSESRETTKQEQRQKEDIYTEEEVRKLADTGKNPYWKAAGHGYGWAFEWGYMHAAGPGPPRSSFEAWLCGSFC